MSNYLNDLFLERDPDHIVLITHNASYSIKDILNLSKSIYDEINKFKDEERDYSFLIDSRCPLVFISALFACIESGSTAVCWDGVSDKLSLAELTSSCSSISASTNYDHFINFKIDSLKNKRWLNKNYGDVVITTSGSSGVPKGVSLNIKSIIHNAKLAGEALKLFSRNLDYWAIDIKLNLMSALSHLLMAWQYKLCLYYMADMPNSSKFDLFRNNKIGFGGAPLQLSKLESSVSTLSSSSLLVSSGDFLSQNLITKIKTKYPKISIASFYGLTEVSGRLCFIDYCEKPNKIGSAGKPLSDFKVKLLKKDTEGVGEICVKSQLIFNGYFLPNKKFLFQESNGWFKTGDLGIKDKDDTYWLIGRNNDVFKVSGEKVDRKSIENCLMEILKDFNYCVLPVTHNLMGTCPALFVSSENGVARPKLSDIVNTIKTKLPSRYIPVYYYLLDIFPKLSNGKLDKQYLINNHYKFNRY